MPALEVPDIVSVRAPVPPVAVKAVVESALPAVVVTLLPPESVMVGLTRTVIVSEAVPLTSSVATTVTV